MNYIPLIWFFIANALGFFVPLLFSNYLRLSRPVYLIPFTLIFGIFLTSYLISSDIDFGLLLLSNWYWGVTGGLAGGLILIKNVISQPVSKRGSVFDVIWAGIVYGMFDALLLSVFPVLVTWLTIGSQEINILTSVYSLAGSALITAVYHLGYPEFRSKKVFLAVMGNLICTAAFLVTGSPLAAVVSHILMHVTAVIHGPETTIQLPPHKRIVFKTS